MRGLHSFKGAALPGGQRHMGRDYTSCAADIFGLYTSGCTSASSVSVSSHARSSLPRMGSSHQLRLHACDPHSGPAREETCSGHKRAARCRGLAFCVRIRSRSERVLHMAHRLAGATSRAGAEDDKHRAQRRPGV